MILTIKCRLFILFLALCTHTFALDWQPQRLLSQRQAEGVLRAGASLRRGLTRALASLPSREARRLQAALASRDVPLTRLLVHVIRHLHPERLPGAPEHCSPLVALGAPFRQFVDSSVLAQLADLGLPDQLLLQRPSTCGSPVSGSEGDYLLELIESQLRQGSLRLTVPLFLGLFNNIVLPCLEPDVAEISRI